MKNDKFRLFKSKRFAVAQRHNLPVRSVVEKTEPFSHKLDCGCVDEYNPGWYYRMYLFGYRKLEGL